MYLFVQGFKRYLKVKGTQKVHADLRYPKDTLRLKVSKCT